MIGGFLTRDLIQLRAHVEDNLDLQMIGGFLTNGGGSYKDTVAVSKNLTYSAPARKLFLGGFGLQGGLQNVSLMHCAGLWVALHAHDVRGSLCGPSGTPLDAIALHTRAAD